MLLLADNERRALFAVVRERLLNQSHDGISMGCAPDQAGVTLALA